MADRRVSLRNQLTIFIVIAVFGAVALATSSFILREISGYGAQRMGELEASAAIFAATISEPVARNDRRETLEALRAIDQLAIVQYVRVELPDKSTFVEFGDAVSLAGDPDAIFRALNRKVISANVPIMRGGEQVGVLHVSSDTSELGRKIREIFWNAASAATFSAAIGLLLTMRMQRSIVNPIINLVQIMRDVQERNDFGMRARRTTGNETGDLVDAFNAMLDTIQDRDARLLAQQENLQKIVTLRTRELKVAKDAAEAANSAKSEFLAAMSHEIRTPMNGMLVMAELINNGDLPPRQKRYAEVIVRSGQSLLSIINDILDFSKIEAGKLELEKIEMRPSDVISDVISLFWERAAKAGVDLVSYIGPGVPEIIEGDPVRINQVLSNLVSNALKFTERGSVVITARRAAADGACVIEFAVSDSGIGIAPEKQERIFEAFSQADQSTTRKFGGTGLGLAICRRLVSAMGGEISVVSRVGKGSKFSFRVPTREIEAARRPAEGAAEMRAVIAVNGTATPIMLSKYLEEAGIAAHIVSSEGPLEAHLAYANIIFASPEYLNALNTVISGDPHHWMPARICVSELGDDAPDRLLREGVAEDLLVRPISRGDMFDQIERIVEGRLRGVAALENSTTHVRQAALFPGVRILAADDSPVNREVVKEALSRLGAEATIVVDGEEAVKAYLGGQFDVILMDCSMPVVDGFEATRRIRVFEQENGGKRTPVIALTAHVESANDDWRKAGMDDYVTKPFTLTQLSSAISNFVQPKITAGANGSAGGASPPSSAPRRQASDFSSFDAVVLAQLEEMQAGGDDLVVRSLDLFATHAKETMLRIARSFKARDAAEVARAAHALKSMSLNVGARSLGEACAALERNAADIRALPELLRAVRREYSAAMDELPSVRRAYLRAAA